MTQIKLRLQSFDCVSSSANTGLRWVPSTFGESESAEEGEDRSDGLRLMDGTDDDGEPRAFGEKAKDRASNAMSSTRCGRVFRSLGSGDWVRVLQEDKARNNLLAELVMVKEPTSLKHG